MIVLSKNKKKKWRKGILYLEGHSVKNALNWYWTPRDFYPKKDLFLKGYISTIWDIHSSENLGVLLCLIPLSGHCLVLGMRGEWASLDKQSCMAEAPTESSWDDEAHSPCFQYTNSQSRSPPQPGSATYICSHPVHSMLSSKGCHSSAWCLIRLTNTFRMKSKCLKRFHLTTGYHLPTPPCSLQHPPCLLQPYFIILRDAHFVHIVTPPQD